MKNFEIIPRKISRQLLKNVALVTCLGFAGFSLPPAHGQQQSVQKAITPKQVTTTRMTFKPVKLTAAELKNVSMISPAAGAAATKSISKTKPIDESSAVVHKIEVTSPANNAIWEAGREYLIKWNGGNNDVRIDLESRLQTASGPLEQYPIVGRASNTGNYRFKVPYNWVINPNGYVVRIRTLDGKQSGSSQGTLTVYTQSVDLECRIVDVKLRKETNFYLVYAEGKRWLEFNVLMRNKGVQSPVTIQNVLVRIIKEPENIVVAQEEWGFSGIYYHDWYRLPEPRKFNISSVEAAPFYADRDVNFENGNYRVEVDLDPRNTLRENQGCRDDNRDVQHWRIN